LSRDRPRDYGDRQSDYGEHGDDYSADTVHYGSQVKAEKARFLRCKIVTQ